MHSDAVSQDRSSAQKSDPGHDLSGDPRRVGVGGARAREPICGDQREQPGPEADDHMRAESRDLPAGLALEPDHAAQDGNNDQPDHDLYVGDGSRAHSR